MSKKRILKEKYVDLVIDQYQTYINIDRETFHPFNNRPYTYFWDDDNATVTQSGIWEELKHELTLLDNNKEKLKLLRYFRKELKQDLEEITYCNNSAEYDTRYERDEDYQKVWEDCEDFLRKLKKKIDNKIEAIKVRNAKKCAR